MKNLTILITAFLVLCLNTTYSQVTQEWVKRYNGPTNDEDKAVSIKVDGSGNIYVTGESQGSGTGLDIATIKYNSAGVQLWLMKYNGPTNGNDVPNSMYVDNFGNVYVTGYTSNGASGYDYITIKYNTAGIQQWVSFYNGPGTTNSSDIATDITVDPLGNVYVTGKSPHDNGGYYSGATIKYNSSGVQQWVHRQEDTVATGLFIRLDGLGNVYTVGQHEFSGSFPPDFYIVKYNSSGVQQWSQILTVSPSTYDVPRGMAVDASGNIYVTGEVTTTLLGVDYYTFKYNTNGVKQWEVDYDGGGQDDFARSIILDASGNVYVTGNSKQSPALSFNCTTIKYNSSGVQQWVRRYITPDNLFSSGNCLSLDAFSNIYISGFVQQAGQQGAFYDYFTIKYTSSGVQQWIQTYNGPGNADDVAISNAVDASYNVYVTGSSVGFGTLADFATIKYSQEIFIIGIPFIRDKIELLKNKVDTLVESQILPPHFGAMLNNNLRVASDHLGQDHNHASLVHMGLFKFEVNLLIQLQILPQQYGQPLILSANEILELIEELNQQHQNVIPAVENKSFSLAQNYPNPFNPATKIKYEIPFNSFVTLKVYDILGTQVASLVNEDLSAGSHEVEWNASSYASGIYFYKLIAEIDGQKFERTMKMILVK